MTKVDISDTLKRPLRGLRISVTDRCNFRCTYCMPFDEYQWVERTQVLSFDEIERLARLFVAQGVRRSGSPEENPWFGEVSHPWSDNSAASKAFAPFSDDKRSSSRRTSRRP